MLFGVDQSALAPEAEPVPNDLAAQLRTRQKIRILLEGHTDSTGSPTHNPDLSRARAASAAQFLTTRGGIPAASVESTGYGETQPIAPNDSEENRAKNRRVEVLILAR